MNLRSVHKKFKQNLLSIPLNKAITSDFFGCLHKVPPLSKPHCLLQAHPLLSQEFLHPLPLSHPNLEQPSLHNTIKPLKFQNTSDPISIIIIMLSSNNASLMMSKAATSIYANLGDATHHLKRDMFPNYSSILFFRPPIPI